MSKLSIEIDESTVPSLITFYENVLEKSILDMRTAQELANGAKEILDRLRGSSKPVASEPIKTKEILSSANTNVKSISKRLEAYYEPWRKVGLAPSYKAGLTFKEKVLFVMNEIGDGDRRKVGNVLIAKEPSMAKNARLFKEVGQNLSKFCFAGVIELANEGSGRRGATYKVKKQESHPKKGG